jgi:hypothetical protein
MTSFADSVARFTKKAEAKVEMAVRKIAIDVFSEVVMMTPVDTGRARGNWQCKIGAIPNGTLELDDTAGTATISAIQAEALNLRAGQPIFLINNLPYIEALEHGHSSQAPSGMVRLTVQRWKPIVAKVAQEIAKQ